MVKKKRLGQIAKIYSGGTPKRNNTAFWGGTIPWVKTSQVQNCVINAFNVNEFITEEGLKHSSAKMVPKGSILMAMIGQGKTRGQVAILGIDTATNQNAAAILIDAQNSGEYVYQQLLYMYKQIRNISNSSGQQNLNLQLIRTIQLFLPTLPEQKAIADLLSTWDEAIEKTETLIKAKEKLFKWLLNELIGGYCKRSGKQEVKLHDVFGDALKIEKGKSLVKKNVEAGEIPVVAGGQSYAYFHNKSTHQGECITISASGAYAGYVWYHNYPIWASDCNVLVVLDGDTKFFFYALKHLQIKIYALQSGGAQPHIYSKDLNTLMVPHPSLPEQKQIAVTLSTAQEEIDLLKKMTERYRTQKRGLMQKILTGEWRVKLEGA